MKQPETGKKKKRARRADWLELGILESMKYLEGKTRTSVTSWLEPDYGKYPQRTIDYRLAKLHEDELVKKRRSGHKVFYSLTTKGKWRLKDLERKHKKRSELEVSMARARSLNRPFVEYDLGEKPHSVGRLLVYISPELTLRGGNVSVSQQLWNKVVKEGMKDRLEEVLGQFLEQYCYSEERSSKSAT